MQNEELKTCTGKKPLPFMRYKWVFIVISVVIMLASAYEIAVNGINFGVDFKGGTKLIYEFDQTISIGEIRDAVSTLGLGDVQVIQFGRDPKANQYMMRAKYVEGKDVGKLVTGALVGKFGKDRVVVMSQEVVGPKVGHDMRKKGAMSVGLACLLILFYIGFRFDFLFSPGAVVALIHDILISVGFFAFFGKEFNLPILAALLTILGYSINDTIVIYDRIRENITRLPKKTAPVDVVNISVTETLPRTIVTSMTSLMVVIVLFFLGGGVLHDFAFCLMIGIIFGTYSSTFIAAPVYLLFQRLFPKRGLKITDPEKEKKEARAAV